MGVKDILAGGDVLFTFRLVIPERDRFLNCEHMHPLKQRQLAEVVHKARNTSTVKALAVFGSTITDNCWDESDIDLVIWDKTHTFRPPNNDAYDLFYADELTEDWMIYNDIVNRGVIIYARDNVGLCKA